MTGKYETLKGREIVGYTLVADGSLMVLTCADGTVATLEPEGDCCSHSWIEDIDAPEALLGVVQDVESIPMPDHGNVDGKRHKGVEEVEYYGLKITTDKGRCVIDYRNDSNGYYGGWLNFSIGKAS